MHLPAGGAHGHSQNSALASTGAPGAGKVYSQLQVGMMLKVLSREPEAKLSLKMSSGLARSQLSQWETC